MKHDPTNPETWSRWRHHCVRFRDDPIYAGVVWYYGIATALLLVPLIPAAIIAVKLLFASDAS